MRNEILIISDGLVEPPSDSMAFRTLTMYSHEEMGLNVLLQTTQEMKDLYYHWMKMRGLMDYVDFILNEKEKEWGVRMDTHFIIGYTYCILTKSIRLDNQLELLGRIRSVVSKK